MDDEVANQSLCLVELALLCEGEPRTADRVQALIDISCAMITPASGRGEVNPVRK